MGFLVPKLPKAPKKKFWGKKKSKARKLAKNNSEPLKPANFLNGEKNVKIFLNSI
jgi:hypothetical protein